MSTASNIFPQLQKNPSMSGSRVSPYKQIAETNRLKLKTIEAQYFQNQYKNILTAKQRQKQAEKQQRQRDRQIAEAKKFAYAQQLQRQMQKKQLQRAYLAMDYQNTIDYQQQKKRNQRQTDKVVDKQILTSPTWLRDANTERQINIRKKYFSIDIWRLYYNQLLEEQVQLQQQRKMNERAQQQKNQQKLRRQADQMLQKQYNQMEAKHRQKSLFQQRQNQLLGVGTQDPNLQESRSYIEKERLLKNTEKQIYRQGLKAQYQKEQYQKNHRRRTISSNTQDLNTHYNPITNPIPFVYKNPNVLRMLNQL